MMSSYILSAILVEDSADSAACILRGQRWMVPAGAIFQTSVTLFAQDKAQMKLTTQRELR